MTSTEYEISHIKTAIIGLVAIAGLATGIIMYTGHGIDQIDMVLGMTVTAIAGLVKK